MKKKVLFVCLGNICRSPSAEAVFNELVRREGLEDLIECDSAATAGYHIGEQPDRRMQSHAMRRGYKLTSVSRKFNPGKDFDEFDYIIGMDNENVTDLQNLASSTEQLNKIHQITEYSSAAGHNSIPDPYYGGSEGFELVIDILEDACQGLLNEVNGV